MSLSAFCRGRCWEENVRIDLEAVDAVLSVTRDDMLEEMLVVDWQGSSFFLLGALLRATA
jgi:hypothetical protein